MENAKTRTMQRAAETLGSMKALADAVDVTPEIVKSWLAGTAAPSNAHYLAALDIVARRARRGEKFADDVVGDGGSRST